MKKLQDCKCAASTYHTCHGIYCTRRLTGACLQSVVIQLKFMHLLYCSLSQVVLPSWPTRVPTNCFVVQARQATQKGTKQPIYFITHVSERVQIRKRCSANCTIIFGILDRKIQHASAPNDSFSRNERESVLKPILAKVGFQFTNFMPWDSRELFMNV